MSDVRITYVGALETSDITTTVTGRPQNLPEEEAVELTNWDKWISFWDRVAAAPLFSEREVEKK